MNSNSQTVQAIVQCRKCGSTQFEVLESDVYKAELKASGVLEVHSCRGGGIDTIGCRNCGQQYGEDEFSAVEWNY